MKTSVIRCLLTAACIGTSSLCVAQSYLPEWKDSRMKVAPKADIRAYAFNLQDVRLLESPFYTAMQAEAKYLLQIEPDRLLSDFRTHAGLTAKAEKYGGWESSGLAGHSLGHYLSACALQYAATGDEAFRERVAYIVDELELCQQHRKTGYVGAIPDEDSMWMEVKAGNIRTRGFDLNGAWAPWYTVHKIMAGLLDAWLYCDNPKALAINEGIAGWAQDIIKDLDDDQLQRMLFCEYGGMSDALVNTYAITGNKKYLDLSYKFYDKRILDSLAAQIDILPGKHSNTQIPKVIGGIRRYQLNLDQKDADIAHFFWNTVTRDHSYVTGGNSNYEYFGAARQLSETLTDNTTETCNTYNMLKLTRHLFALQPEAQYMDYYERALYNHILASQHHETGMVCYFVPLRMGGTKHYSDPWHSFTCCVGTGMENHVKYGESIYSRGKDGSLYVNLFIPSELDWKEKGVRIRQESTLPDTKDIRIRVSAGKPAAFPIRIRQPRWAKTGVKLTINGQQQTVTPDAQGYLVIDRTWEQNDEIRLTLPVSLYTEAMPDNPSRQAVFYGPVLLAGVLGEKEPDPVSGVPVFVTGQPDVAAWIKRTGGPGLEFSSTAVGRPSDVKLVPFHDTQNQYYSVYWDVFTPAAWAEQQQVYEARKKAEKELEARTVDILRTGEMQPERDHAFTGEKTSTAEDHGRKWRIARPGGYFSFTMKVAPEGGNTLICTYWGMDNRGRNFDIQVDGQTIATEDLNKYKASKFYDISYKIPEKLTKGRSAVVIKFVPKPQHSAGPLYGSRIVRE